LSLDETLISFVGSSESAPKYKRLMTMTIIKGPKNNILLGLSISLTVNKLNVRYIRDVIQFFNVLRF